MKKMTVLFVALLLSAAFLAGCGISPLGILDRINNGSLATAGNALFATSGNAVASDGNALATAGNAVASDGNASATAGNAAPVGAWSPTPSPVPAQ